MHACLNKNVFGRRIEDEGELLDARKKGDRNDYIHE